MRSMTSPHKHQYQVNKQAAKLQAGAHFSVLHSTETTAYDYSKINVKLKVPVLLSVWKKSNIFSA